MNLSSDLIVYTFSREKVEGCDFSHFMSLYAASRLPHGSALKALMGTLIFSIEGYDGDPREVYLIDEVRRFYTACHAAWLYWLFFHNLRQDSLMPMVVCCLQSLTAYKVERKGSV